MNIFLLSKSSVEFFEDKKKLDETDKLFIESIDGIFALKETLMGIFHEERMSFSAIDTIKTEMEIKREQGRDLAKKFTEFKKIGKLIGYTNNSKSPNHKIWSKSIAAGFFGMKNDATLFGERAKKHLRSETAFIRPFDCATFL